MYKESLWRVLRLVQHHQHRYSEYVFRYFHFAALATFIYIFKTPAKDPSQPVTNYDCYEKFHKISESRILRQVLYLQNYDFPIMNRPMYQKRKRNVLDTEWFYCNYVYNSDRYKYSSKIYFDMSTRTYIYVQIRNIPILYVF